MAIVYGRGDTSLDVMVGVHVFAGISQAELANMPDWLALEWTQADPQRLRWNAVAPENMKFM